MKASIVLTGVALAFATPAAATTVIDGINVNANPIEGGTYAANNVGWFYTPTFSYQLAGLATRFGSADGRAVGAAFYSGTPGSLVLLGSGNLAASTSFTQALFGSPVSLTSGTQYFFAFTDVAGLGANVTNDPGATNLAGGLRFDFGAPPGTFLGGPETGFTAQPIVQFLGVAGGVPEPSTWAMMILGFGFLGVAMRSAKRGQKITVSYA